MRALVVRHIAIEGPGLLTELMQRAGWTLDLRAMDVGDELPRDPGDYQAVVVLGGPMNVYEEHLYPYLKPLDRLLKEAMAREMPVLGICLGAQLMAKALGAAVTKNPVKEIGWYTVTLTDAGRSDPLFAGLEPSLPVFHWHGDTFAIPAGAVHLARAPSCPAQAFRYGRAAYAFQFHLEVTADMVAEWTAAYAPELAAFGATAVEMQQATAAQAPRCAAIAATVLGRWLALAGG